MWLVIIEVFGSKSFYIINCILMIVVGEYLGVLCIQLVALCNGWYFCLSSIILYCINDIYFLNNVFSYCSCDIVNGLGFGIFC